LAAVYWPFRYREIHPLLEEMFGNQVRIGHYHRVYFPHPGFIATNLTLSPKNRSNRSPRGTVETLSVQGNWHDVFLFRDRVRLVEITGFHLLVHAPGSDGNQSRQPLPQDSNATPPSNTDQFEGPTTAVEHLLIHNSILDIMRKNGGHYNFAIRELDITGFERGHPWHYTVDMENPLPAGHVAATGSFGPLKYDDVGATPVSGQFTFNQVKLSDIGILHGTLASSGHFNGPLGAIQAEAISDTPDFSVDDGLPTHIRGFIRCTVNGLNGDVIMPQVEVSSGRTVIRAHGQVAGSPKLTNLDIDVDNGRAEEVLHPFVHEKVPILGPATIHSHAFVAAPGPSFLQRLRIDGRFAAPAEKAADHEAEKAISDFSHRQKENDHDSKSASDPPPAGDVLSSLTGPATIRNGIVTTTGLVFQIPGAKATLHGTFAFHGQVAHLVGILKTDADLSHATTGWKSIILKPLQPFFRRKDRSGSEIPIAVIGNPGHFQVKQDISGNR
jgi:hypothetical protein